MQKAQIFDKQRPMAAWVSRSIPGKGRFSDDFLQYAHNRCLIAKVISGL